MRAILRIGAALVLALTITACASRREEGEARGGVTELIDPANALSEELMLTLGQAKNFHHKANVLMSDGKLDDAAAQVLRILNLPFPKHSPEAEDVLLDARARLAQMRLAQGQIEAAMTLVDDGLREKTRASFFVANLHTVRGEVFEAMAARAEEGSEASRSAKIDAIKSFDASIQINNQLLQELAPGNK